MWGALFGTGPTEPPPTPNFPQEAQNAGMGGSPFGLAEHMAQNQAHDIADTTKMQMKSCKGCVFHRRPRINFFARTCFHVGGYSECLGRSWGPLGRHFLRKPRLWFRLRHPFTWRTVVTVSHILTPPPSNDWTVVHRSEATQSPQQSAGSGYVGPRPRL
jgi:hypothetical protein